ncbi:MAG: hypothetical protein IMY85_10485 [Chloroflexi bacterium]|nr:hypothetical protein [Chloroflexota bacterium]
MSYAPETGLAGNMLFLRNYTMRPESSSMMDACPIGSQERFHIHDYPVKISTQSKTIIVWRYCLSKQDRG